jgi:putative ATPase
MNLAANLRPKNFSEFVGQEHLAGEQAILRRIIKSEAPFSLILWGPPGSGKTTLAYIIANELNADFHAMSAVETGKADLHKVIDSAKENQKKNIRTILFIDEIHRWNKAQQDALLPHVENGTLNLIGATTENPSFEVISALLSRSKILILKALSFEQLEIVLDRAIKDKNNGLGKLKKKIATQAKELLIRLSGGDARIMLNALEIAANSYKAAVITADIIKEVFQTKSAGLYDKKADEHYNTISSYIKSMRASKVDAALHYLARMVLGGEDPKFIARRMVIFASEDIGMAQPTALVVANEVFRACETIGYPECAINLAHGTVYMAKAKKDRSSHDAYFAAVEDVKSFPNEPIPLHLRNAPTKLMKNLGYGKNYSWKEGNVGAKEGLSYLPEKFKDRKYYKEKD